MEFKLYDAFPLELESEWNTLLAESIVHVPFLRYEYLKTWWQTRGGGEWPEDARLAIVTARLDGQLVGLAPLFWATWEDQPTLLLLGSIEVSDYLDFLARPADLPAFIEALLAFLDAENGRALPAWQRLDLYNVLEDSGTLPALETAAHKLGLSYLQEPFRPSLYISLPGDWETYLAGIDKKQRHEIRRKIRRAYSGDQEVRWYITNNAETIDSEIDAFLALMEQDPEKASFLTPSMRENFRLTVRCAFEAGCLNLAFLEVNGQKAAAYLNFDYLNRLWIYNSGMDRSFNEYSPGWVLLGELLKWANDNGREGFDFMRGDEDYKFRFGAKKRDVMHLIVRK
jgi:CelD/BcsL family acetyltransferase involved in cellulose biosynthesis